MKYLAKILAVTAFSFSAFAQNKPVVTNQPSLTNSAIRTPQRFDRSALEIPSEHRAKVEEINRAYATNATPVYQRLSTARREMETLVNQENVTEAVLRAKAKDIGDLEAELAIARSKRYTQLRAFLTPEQARRFNVSAPLARSFQPALHDGAAPLVAPNK